MEHYERGSRKRRQIEKTLLVLLQQHPLSQINVTRLTEQLGISRKNFYDHYPNIDACLHGMIDRMIMDAAIHATTVSTDSRGFLQLCVCSLEYWKAQKPFLQVIDQNGLEDLLTERYLHHLMSETWHMYCPVQTGAEALDEDVVYFFSGSIVKVVMRWYRRGFDTPVEEMAGKFYRLLREPLLRERA